METVVPVENLPYIQDRFEDFAKRAKKLRVPAPELHIGERTFERVFVGENSLGERVFRMAEKVALSVTGERPQLGGWEPVANLVHANGANVMRVRPGFELPEMYRTRQICDHCGHNRKRNDTWVLRNADGELFQVGRQCIQDFIGGADVNLASLSMWAEVGSFFGESEEPGMGGERFYSVGDYLAAVAACIRVDRSFTTKKLAAEKGCISTAEYAFSVLSATPETYRYNPGMPRITADDVDAANKAREWCAAWTESGDYPHNVRTAVGMGYVTHKTAGFVASLLGSAMPNAMKKAAERSAKPVTRHFPSDVGARVETTVDVVKVRSWQGDYGLTTFVEMRDGDIACVWYASGSVDVKEGDRVRIKGTIKRHGTDRYTSGNVTTLTRCKILEKVS